MVGGDGCSPWTGDGRFRRDVAHGREDASFCIRSALAWQCGERDHACASLAEAGPTVGFTPPHSCPQTPRSSDDEGEEQLKSYLMMREQEHVLRSAFKFQGTPELEDRAVGQLLGTECLVPHKATRLFRPKGPCGSKILVLVRHGESEYNRASASPVHGCDDPSIFDPDLTIRGRRQCIDLRQHLQRDVDVRDALWVVSPLTRALQTFLLSCPMLSTHAMTDRFLRTWPLGTNTADAYHAEMYQPHTSQKARSREADAARSPFAWGRVLAPQNAATPSARECPLRGTERGAPAPAPACPGTADPATPVPGAWSPVRPAWSRAMVPDAAFSPAPAATPSGAPLVMVAAGPSASVTPAPSVRVGRHSVKTVVLPCVTEVMVTPGDVGRPTSCLKEMFQEVMPSGSFEAVGEHWWFRGGAATAEGNSALARRFKYPEPRESLHKRIEAFTKFALDRPERVIVVVAHSCFLRKLMVSLGAEERTLKNGEHCKIVL